MVLANQRHVQFADHGRVPPLLRGRIGYVGEERKGALSHHVEFCGYRRWVPATWVVDLPSDQEATAGYMIHALFWHDEDDPALATLLAAESATEAVDGQLWNLCQRLTLRPDIGNGSATWVAHSLKDLARNYRFVKERVTPDIETKLEQLWSELAVLNRQSIALQQEYLRR